MSKKKPSPGGRAKKKTAVSLIRSSAAEYLTFVAASGQGGVEAVYADENVWLTQKMMGLLYDVDVRTISYHLKNVFADHELEESSVIQFFRITAADGKSYDTQHYNLSAIIAVGFKTENERAVQFRKDDVRCFSLSASNDVPRSRERERVVADRVRDVGGKHSLAERAGVRCRNDLPPKGNTNSAWVQHFIQHLALDGNINGRQTLN